jgi:hypothetical protein
MTRTRWRSDPCYPGLLPRPSGSDRQRRWVPKSLGPGRQIDRKTTRTASADSEVRPGPRLPTLEPPHRRTGEAEPKTHYKILPADYGRRPSRRTLAVMRAVRGKSGRSLLHRQLTFPGAVGRWKTLCDHSRRPTAIRTSWAREKLWPNRSRSTTAASWTAFDHRRSPIVYRR